jgi:glycosyltransferase involved in cell wall biosynthesis
MRVFMVSTVFAPSVGGVEIQAEMLASDLVALGNDVVVATDTPGGGLDGIPFVLVRRPSLRDHLRLLAWCDVCHHQQISLKRTLPVLWPPRKPIVVTHHLEYARSDGSHGWRNRLKLAVSKVTCNVSCSSFIARQFDETVVIENQYDSNEFRRQNRNRDLDLIFVGRLVAEKGGDLLLAALEILRARGRRPTLTVVGDGAARRSLEAECRRRGLSDQVRFTGGLERAEVANELNRHRVLVVPSRQREGFPLVVLEGLACGCLPVVARHGGLVDAIGSHGLAFENGDVRDLAARLEEVLSHGDLISRKLEGVERYVARHERRFVAQRYLEVYRAAAASSWSLRPARPSNRRANRSKG